MKLVSLVKLWNRVTEETSEPGETRDLVKLVNQAKLVNLVKLANLVKLVSVCYYQVTQKQKHI